MAVLVLSMDFGLKGCLHGIWSASIPSIGQNLVKIISKRDHGPCVIFTGNQKPLAKYLPLDTQGSSFPGMNSFEMQMSNSQSWT